MNWPKVIKVVMATDGESEYQTHGVVVVTESEGVLGVDPFDPREVTTIDVMICRLEDDWRAVEMIDRLRSLKVRAPCSDCGADGPWWVLLDPSSRLWLACTACNRHVIDAAGMYLSEEK